MKFHAAFGFALLLGEFPLLAVEKPTRRDFISRMLDPATRRGAFRCVTQQGVSRDTIEVARETLGKDWQPVRRKRHAADR